MQEELSLVTELAIILVAAGVFTVISKALKQPIILGYIVAGFLVGPHLGIFPQFSTESVHEWSELGIIFLLFSLGLEFSFKKLLKVGSSALITSGTKCIGMFVVGLLAGTAMGWTLMESIFLGGLLGMSSTTIIIKVYEDLGYKKKPYAGLIFGSLVVEDLIAVILLVLLSTLAVSNSFSGSQMAFSLAKMVFFLVLWFLVGIYVIPTVLKKAHKYLSDEILLITGIGLCFGMVVLATMAGFSSALGAFVMGSILSETLEGERIEHLTSSIKDLFGAIFFVSVGMMLDPAVIAAQWAPILVITLITIVGILIFSTSGVLFAGKGLDTAVHAGFSLCQLGEFAFIIASLGCTLGVMRDFIYPVIIAVSVITTFTTPYMIKFADPVLVWLKKKLPQNVLFRLEPAQENDSSSKAEQSEWKGFLSSLLVRMGLYGVMIIAILLASKQYLAPLVGRILPSVPELWQNIIVTVVTLAVLSPFLYGFSLSDGNTRAHVSKLLKENPANKWPVLSIFLLRVMLGVGIAVMAVVENIDLAGWSVVLLIIATLVLFLALRSNFHKVSVLEDRFLSNLNEKEEAQRRLAPVSSSVKEKLGGYDVHTAVFEISPDFAYAGQSLRQMPFRHRSGANVVKITRGSRQILIPSGDEVVFPGDRILAVGTQEQLDAMAVIMEESVLKADTSSPEEFDLQLIELRADSYLTGKTLKGVDMRHSGAMVISVVREGKVITNPGPDFKFAEGDSVWISGLKSSLEWYR